MTRSIRYLPALCCAAVLAGVAGCADFNLLSTQEEVAIGQKVAAQVEQKATVYADSSVQQYVREIGARLVNVCDRRDVTYRFTVLEDHKQVNAFAAPGGFLYVYTGLLRAADNEAEVAGVLAHEIGHVVGKHSAKALSNRYALAVLLRAATGSGDGGIAGGLAGQLLAGAGLSKMSRSAEFQADQFGALYLKRAGYDPRAMASFLVKLNALKKSNPGALSQLFATHPPTQDRIALVNQLVAQVGPGGALNARAYRQRLAGLLAGRPAPAQPSRPPGGARAGPRNPPTPWPPSVWRSHFAAPQANAAPHAPLPPSKRQAQGRHMICRNLTKGNVVLSRCTIADTRRTRARGLLGRHTLAPDEGMLLTPCRSIHMIGMKFPIDVVFLDKRMRVVALHRNVRPGRLRLRCGKARSTLEIAAGVIDAHRIEVGDLLGIAEPSSDQKPDPAVQKSP